MKHRVKTVFFIGLALIALFGMTACPQKAKPKAEQPAAPAVKKYKVTLVNTVGGTVTVKPALPADGMVAENTILTFTATPNSNYALEKWELNGSPVNGTALTYKLKVTANAQVMVFFKQNGAPPPTKYRVTLTAPVNGSVTSSPEIPSDNQVPENTEITFTATPAEGCAVDTWTVTPSGALQTGGSPGSRTAKVKITEDTTITVTFKKLKFKIDFGVDGTPPHGTLTAKVDGTAISSGDTVEHGKTVTFTAKPNTNYKVKEWKVDG